MTPVTPKCKIRGSLEEPSAVRELIGRKMPAKAALLLLQTKGLSSVAIGLIAVGIIRTQQDGHWSFSDKELEISAGVTAFITVMKGLKDL